MYLHQLVYLDHRMHIYHQTQLLHETLPMSGNNQFVELLRKAKIVLYSRTINTAATTIQNDSVCDHIFSFLIVFPTF